MLARARTIYSLLSESAAPFVKRRLVATLLLIAIASVLTGLGPIALKYAVDNFSRQPGNGAISILLVLLYAASQFMSRAISDVRSFVYARAERRMFSQLSERVFCHVMHLPLRFHVERETGALAQTIDNGLQAYQMILNRIVFSLLPGIGELATTLVVLFRFQHHGFVLLFAAGIVCFTGAWAVSTFRIADRVRRATNIYVSAVSTMIDAVLNYETVKFFAAEQAVQERVHRKLSLTENEWVDFYRSSARNSLSVTVVYGMVFALIEVYAASEVRRGSMSVGDFVLANTFLLQALRPVELLGNAMNVFSQSAAMLCSMLDLLNEPPEGAVRIESAPVTIAGDLVFDDVRSSYGTQREILKSVSFRVPAGKTLGIVGSSGAGKSTLVRLLVRLIEPDAGRILLDGTPITALPLRQLRRLVAVVPQDTALFNDTIAYNIAFSKPGCSQSEVEDAARAAHLHEFIAGLPEGYETKIGERGIKLSGGERQRIAIARAVLQRPRIYVFDEATSSLDSRTEREILQNIYEISRSSTTLIIGHRLSTVVHADEIIVLGGGIVLERGTHSELVDTIGPYADLWRAQFTYWEEVSDGKKGAVR